MTSISYATKTADNQRELNPKEYKLLNTLADGNCFFNAVVDNINCNILESNPEFAEKNFIWSYLKDFDKTFILRKITSYLFASIILKKRQSTTMITSNENEEPSYHYEYEDEDELFHKLYNSDKDKDNDWLSTFVNKAISFEHDFSKINIENLEIRTSDKASKLLTCFLIVNNVIPSMIIDNFIIEYDNFIKEEINNGNVEVIQLSNESKNAMREEVAVKNFLHSSQKILKTNPMYSSYLERQLLKRIVKYIQTVSCNKVHVSLWIFGSLINTLFGGIFRIKYALLENESSQTGTPRVLWASKAIGDYVDNNENITRLFNHLEDNPKIGIDTSDSVTTHNEKHQKEDDPLTLNDKHTLYFLDHSPFEHFDAIYRKQSNLRTFSSSQEEIKESVKRNVMDISDWDLEESLVENIKNNKDIFHDPDEFYSSVHEIPIFNDDEEITMASTKVSENDFSGKGKGEGEGEGERNGNNNGIIVSKYHRPKSSPFSFKNDDREGKRNIVLTFKSKNNSTKVFRRRGGEEEEENDEKMFVEEDKINHHDKPFFFNGSELEFSMTPGKMALNEYIQFLCLVENQYLAPNTLQNHLIGYKAYLFIKEAKKGEKPRYSPLGEMNNISSVFPKEEINGNLLIYNYRFLNERWKANLLKELTNLSQFLEVKFGKRGVEMFNFEKDFKEFYVTVYYQQTCGNNPILKEVYYRSEKWSNLDLFWNITAKTLKNVSNIFLVIAHNSVNKSEVLIRLTNIL